MLSFEHPTSRQFTTPRAFPLYPVPTIVLSFTITAPNFLLEHVLRAATLRAISRKYMVLSGRSMFLIGEAWCLLFSCRKLFWLFVVFVFLAGDDIFALLICDEDLEFGARHIDADDWCLIFWCLGRLSHV